jgi:hypothetical protein
LAGLFGQCLSAHLLSPEPGPVGLSVDPLGEALGARLLPDGFMVALPLGAVGPVVVDVPVPAPTVPEVPVPLLAAPVAAPPAVEPAAAPPAWAKARVEDIARAPASAIVVSFMVYFLRIMTTNNSSLSVDVPRELRPALT